MRRLLLLTALFSMLYVSSAYAMVTMSRHNLSSTQPLGTIGTIRTTATSEVCVFCHTPHGGTADAPLWNRAMATAGAYTAYSSSTIDTSIGQPDGISLACLSCHDGTIALDALRNQTGSGTIITGTISSAGWTFVGLGTSTNNSLPEDGRITNLTQDLSNDHPVSMTYPTAVQDPKFVQTYTTLGTARWFEETANTRADDNEVKLYQTPPVTGTYKVQCASCHNPHGTTAALGTPANQLAPNNVDYATFLRKSNASSALCTTCHIK
ncbi:MAG: hypothetical protein WA240_16240 [Nitrospirota bacterium]